MEPVVHFRAAVSLLGRFPALAGVDLDVQRGEIVLTLVGAVGDVVVVVLAVVDVVVASWASSRFPSRSWAWACRMPVPHSW